MHVDAHCGVRISNRSAIEWNGGTVIDMGVMQGEHGVVSVRKREKEAF